MKRAILFLSILPLVLGSISCKNNGTAKDAAQALNSSVVNVYYFHFTSRCATCLAVEENARKAVEELYPDEVNTGDYAFSSLNLDEADAKAIANELKVGGQSLIIVHGKNRIDITSSAWMAAHDPEKMKEEIRSGVDKVML